MKRNVRIMTAAVAALTTAALAGCDDNNSGGGTGVDRSPQVVTGTITANTTWQTGQTYVLSGYVKVADGATLTIEPGTTIVGDTTVAGSSLFILRGAKIVANGTRAQPIVFTSQRAPGSRAPGDWGGLVIIGNGLINRTSNPIFTEGPAEAQENYAGGTDFNDSSGSLRYVRIEFAGYDITQSGDELNSISSYAVGRGTTYDYVQSMAGLDDSFEFFGGSVDVRHLVSYESGDDHFDWTEGFQGRGQFLIALQTTVLQPRTGSGTVSSDPRGFEGDGCETKKGGCVETNQPYSAPVFANFAAVGPGTAVFSATDGNGVVIRRGSGGTFVNGIVARWPGVAFSLRDAATQALLDADTITVRNIVLADNGAAFDAPGKNLGPVLDQPSNNIVQASSTASLFVSLPAVGAAPSTGSLNWTTAPGSTAASAGLASFAGTRIAGRVNNFFGGSMPATAYAGAADPAAPNWWEGWTVYLRN